MNKIRPSVALIAALLIAVPFALMAGDETEVKREVKIKILQDGDLIDLDLDDVEVGETREFKSESGKEVVVTRNEEGFEVTVDGKKIELFKDLSGVVSGPGKHVVRIEKRIGDGDDDAEVETEAHKVIVVSGDKGGTVVADGGAYAFVEGEGTLEEVLKSGALDKLDAKTREEVIEALKKAFAEHKGGKHEVKVIVKTDKDD